MKILLVFATEHAVAFACNARSDRSHTYLCGISEISFTERQDFSKEGGKNEMCGIKVIHSIL